MVEIIPLIKRNGLGKIYKSIHIFERFPPRRKTQKFRGIE